MKKTNQEVKKANQEEKKVNQEEPATGDDGQAPSARSLLAGLVTNMLHSPISWASVYLADQAITISSLCLSFRFCFLEKIFNGIHLGATTTGVLAGCSEHCFGNNIHSI